ncbi:tyrosine-type recombinase/integrase [Streptomyces sp. NPDC102340]|uniref:tyrosine-type recombinase/integrase n=1 Tax=unclassified Streptomyces TaxID=2593676 RepID=UPI003806E37E
MASIVERPKKSGETTYQVKWREGGAWQSEKFGDEPSAEQFKQLVEAHGGQWPHGWTKGYGFVEPEQDPDDMPLTDWAYRFVDRLTGVDKRTKADYRRDIDRHFAGIPYTTASGTELRLGALVHIGPDGQPRPATVCNVTEDDIALWVASQDAPLLAPDDDTHKVRPKASPKSIANRHGLLYCIFQAAMKKKPEPLRADNPCEGTSLPRTDDHIEEEMCFLERDEYARISTELRTLDPDAADLADFLVGTGLRWGEASGLQVRDVNLTQSTISIQRAWKRTEKNTFELGPPKTRKARRTVKLNESQMTMLRRHMAGRAPGDFIFRGGQGKAWRHSNFYHRKWERALKEATKKGLTKEPRLHDLRHTHVAWLIAANIPLPAIQIRLGHESITTTVDRYGHLVQALDGEIAAAVEAAMAVPSPREGLRPVSAA